MINREYIEQCPKIIENEGKDEGKLEIASSCFAADAFCDFMGKIQKGEKFSTYVSLNTKNQDQQITTLVLSHIAFNDEVGKSFSLATVLNEAGKILQTGKNLMAITGGGDFSEMPKSHQEVFRSFVNALTDPKTSLKKVDLTVNSIDENAVYTLQEILKHNKVENRFIDISVSESSDPFLTSNKISSANRLRLDSLRFRLARVMYFTATLSEIEKKRMADVMRGIARGNAHRIALLRQR